MVRKREAMSTGKNEVRLLVFLSLIFFYSVGWSEVFYTPGEYGELYNEKVALELQIKSLKRQYGNERRRLLDEIKALENQLEALKKEEKALVEQFAYERKHLKNKISELEKRTDILKKKGSDTEKELIEQNRSLQKRCSEDLADLRGELETARKKHLEELSALKTGYEGQISQLNSLITNLNGELDELKRLNMEQKKQLSRMSNQAKELEKQLNEEIKKGEIRLKKFHDRLVINIDEKISFDSGKAVLKRGIRPSLKKIAVILNQYPEYRIIVEGHTDNVPIRNRKFKDNWELSAARALAVLDYLLTRKDLNPKRFTVQGRGEYSPIVPNNTAKNRALNRRVDIIVVPIVKPAEK